MIKFQVKFQLKFQLFPAEARFHSLCYHHFCRYSIEVCDASVQFIAHAWCSLAFVAVSLARIRSGNNPSLSTEERQVLPQVLKLLRSSAFSSLLDNSG